MSFLFPSPLLQQVPNPLNLYYGTGKPTSASLEPKLGSISVDNTNMEAFILLSKDDNTPDWQRLLTEGDATVLTIDADSGSADETDDGIINLITGNSTLNAGSSVLFSATGSTVTLNVTDSNNNNIIGKSSGNLTLTGSRNNSLGLSCLSSLTSGTDNSIISYLGLNLATSASYNAGIGTSVLSNLLTGSNNFAGGRDSGTSYVGAESSNILINNNGVISESNVLRIGSGTGSSAKQLNKAFISGINGVTSSNAQIVTINSSTDQLGVLPISSYFNAVVIQTFTTSGTYTPTASMAYCTIEVVGGGGGGGGAGATTATQVACGAGGGGGGYGRKTVSAATIGSSQTVTVGTGGAGGIGTGVPGNGVTSSVGSIVTATGGNAGGSASGATVSIAVAGTGGAGASGDVNASGQPGLGGAGLYQTDVGAFLSGGLGGNSIFGGGGICQSISSNGQAGHNYGGGGGSAYSANDSAHTGGAGASGLVIITEYIA